jgi:undecaprenyl-diphosphatase
MFGELVLALILAVVQGATEWLPISSSGHLVLLEKILGYDGGLIFEVAVHFGTLMAVFVYFGKDIVDIMQDFFNGRWKTENGKTALLLIVASVPAAIIGFFAAGIFDTILSSLGILALGFGITGLLMLITSYHKGKSGKAITPKKAFIIGLAQALAIVPGVSRAGATISSGILLGLSEKNAMRFSFLMSIPIILGASLVSLRGATLPPEMIWASLVSFIVGLATIHLLFRYVLIDRKNFKWFGIYCLALSAAIIAWIFLF